MARVNLLRDALRKLRIGLLKEEQVSEIFNRVQEKLVQYTEYFDGYRYELRTYKAEDLERYEQLLFSINDGIEKKRYHNVIQQVTAAKKVRQQIHESLSVIKQYAQAKAFLELLFAEINAEMLYRMPSVKVLENILATAEEHMKQGRYQQAQLFIKFCAVETEHLQDSQVSAENRNALLSRIEQLKAVCQGSSEFTTPDGTLSLEVSGRVEWVLHKLLEEKQLILVGKLVGDLEILLQERSTFHTLYTSRQAQNDVDNNLKKEVAKAIKENGWAGGTNTLLTTQMDLFSTSLAETAKKLEEVQASKNNRNGKDN